ncbi:aliphatic sulfonate ABC transporter substrate-binding protein [Collimonas sp. OK412]|uniref:aliphatic sulfonate ABC transporter substrate-binding protein n=1 Tax=Collimonas sp. (strain OK412) TaxID=1801619 RepID=UPI0008EC2BBE|nr:aliphatic sulfonate ABC transporter substrate-binding protein [Collimonas sp. OK412]SFB76237.1 sulfonate transport system substrate-binding protein [Collimonas sp. OK412]
MSDNNQNRTSRRRLLQAGIGMAAVAALTPFAVRAAQRELRVGYQKGLLSLLKKRGTLEQRLAPLGVAVKWIEFSAGPVQLEALNVGSIDFGDVGEAPPIFAQANGTPIVYIAATVPRPAVEAVLIPAASAIRTVADLKGKKIALNKGSNVHYFLVKLLQKSGLNYSDVNPVWLSPADARAAFEKGVVDAWVIWEPFLAAAEKTLSARILAIAVEELNRIDIWGRANRSDLAAELAAVWGLPKPIVDTLVARSSFGTEPITRSILAEQQLIADTFFDLKLIPRQIDVRDAAPATLG